MLHAGTVSIALCPPMSVLPEVFHPTGVTPELAPIVVARSDLYLSPADQPVQAGSRRLCKGTDPPGPLRFEVYQSELHQDLS